MKQIIGLIIILIAILAILISINTKKIEIIEESQFNILECINQLQDQVITNLNTEIEFKRSMVKAKINRRPENE